MLRDETRHQLQHIIRGTVIESPVNSCTAARNHLCAGFATSRVVKKDFESQSVIKKEQAHALKVYALKHRCWFLNTSGIGEYLAKGGESTIYLSADNKQVVKLNDGIYYATWLEYLNSLVMHNLFFPETAYTLLGFTETAGELMAIVQQPYILADGLADLENVRQLLAYNGFEKKKREDYFNREYGLLLEDMHDENILSREGMLFFIDTVFYLATM